MQTTKKPCKLFVYKAFALFGPTLRRPLAVRRGNEHLRTPERLSARYAITKHCPPIRRLHNRIELHLACLVLFYDIKVIVFSEKCKCVFLPCILATFRLNILFSQAHIEYILTDICLAISDFNEMVSLLSSSLVLRHVLMFTAKHSPKCGKDLISHISNAVYSP